MTYVLAAFTQFGCILVISYK